MKEGTQTAYEGAWYFNKFSVILAILTITITTRNYETMRKDKSLVSTLKE